MTIGGSLLPLVERDLKTGSRQALVAFGAGVLLGAAFLHLVPEAVERNHLTAGLAMAGAFVLVFGVEQFTLLHACPEQGMECPVHVMGWVTLMALLVHNAMDGVAIAGGFAVSSGVGMVAAVAVISHSFPTGLSLSAILLEAGYSRPGAFWRCVVLGAVIPLGAAAASFLLPRISESSLAVILGISGGSFIYIGATDLLPRLHQPGQKSGLVYFALGLGIMALTAIGV